MYDFSLPGYGLGTIISFLSMILHAKVEVKIKSNFKNLQFLNDFRQVFQLDFSKLIFEENLDPLPHLPPSNYISDWGKVYAPYFGRDQICFRGTCYQLEKPRDRPKPMIGMTCYRNRKDIFYESHADKFRKFPYNKIYSIESYAKIWIKLRELGYDVINLDEPIPLEDKCFLMNEYCDAIIGYEGGIMHLAHCLKIPCMILPFRFCTEGRDLGINYRIPDKIHLDKKTYFLKDLSEFFQMSRDSFENLILDLRVHKGYNNYYFINNFFPISTNLWKDTNGKIEKPNLFSVEENFINETYRDMVIGG